MVLLMVFHFSAKCNRESLGNIYFIITIETLCVCVCRLFNVISYLYIFINKTEFSKIVIGKIFFALEDLSNKSHLFILQKHNAS